MGVRLGVRCSEGTLFFGGLWNASAVLLISGLNVPPFDDLLLFSESDGDGGDSVKLLCKVLFFFSGGEEDCLLYFLSLSFTFVVDVFPAPNHK